MTVSLIEFNGFDTTKNRVIPDPQPPVITNIGTDWVRPSEWPAATSISVSDQKAAILVAVYDDDNNWIRFAGTTSSGNYTVDWGDGVTENIASGVTATHTYDYATLSGSVTSYGYKTATIIVTPQTANLTGLNFNLTAPSNETVYQRILEVLVGSPNLTSLVFERSTAFTQNAFLRLLEHIKIVSMSSSYTNFNNLFYGMVNLQSIELPDMGNVTSMSATFGGLAALEKFPDLSATSATTMANFFIDNVNLKSVGNLSFNTASNANLFGLFANCRNLELVGNITGRIVNGGNMFVNCQQLKSVGYVQAEYLTTMPTFVNCLSLDTLPYWNTVNIANMNSSFQFCSSLKTIPNWDFSNVTNMGNTFNSCQSLTTVDLNLPKVTNLSASFANCQSLQFCNITTTGNLTSTDSMFSGDFALEKVNISNVSNVTNASFMYSFTTSLDTINDQSFSNATNCRGMFSNSSINFLPNQNFASAANIEYMFANTRGALSLGNLVTNANNTGPFAWANSTVTDLKWTPAASATTIALNVCAQGSFYLKSFEIVSSNLTTFSNAQLAFLNCTTLEKVTFPTTMNFNTTAGAMFSNNPSLREIPPMNVNAAFSANVNVRSLAVANLQNIQANVLINVGGLTKDAIETVFGNLVAGNTTLRNINIASNPGTDTVVTKSSNTTSGSNVVVIANTVGLSTGMLVTGNNISNGRSVTFQGAGDTVTLTAHGISNNNIVSFSTITTTTGISVYTPYYVVNSATDTFQVASTEGGAALPLTNDGTGTLNYGTFIDTINANANVIVSIPASGTATGQTLTFSILNTSIATLKNWSVTR